MIRILFKDSTTPIEILDYLNEWQEEKFYCILMKEDNKIIKYPIDLIFRIEVIK